MKWEHFFNRTVLSFCIVLFVIGLLFRCCGSGNTGLHISDVVYTPPNLPRYKSSSFISGEEVDHPLRNAMGGKPPLTYSLTGLPYGLVLTHELRIQGSTTQLGEHNLVYEVKDIRGNSDEVCFQVLIIPEKGMK